MNVVIDGVEYAPVKKDYELLNGLAVSVRVTDDITRKSWDVMQTNVELAGGLIVARGQRVGVELARLFWATT